MSKIEKRNCEIRASQGDEMALVGRALSYKEISSNELCPGLRERIMPGAFAKSLASGQDVKAYLNHDSKGLPLGRLGNGTLKLTDSDEGLDMRVQLDPEQQLHRDIYASVKRRDIHEMSFAFISEDEDLSAETYQGQPCQVRNVKQAQLLDVSVVCEPFYGADATSVSARSADVAWATDVRKRLDAAMQEPKKPQQTKEPPTTEELRARAARFGTQMATRAGAAVDETEEDDMQDLVTARFGMARNGLVPRYIVTETHSNHVVACDMNEDEMCFCCIPYSNDGDRVSFGEPEISTASYPTRSLTLMEAKSKVAFVQRMAAESGRTFRR